MDKLVEDCVTKCLLCQATNPEKKGFSQNKRETGTSPGVHWEVDFTEVRPGKYGYRHHLVFVDTFSGWIEAYPTQKETINSG